MNQVFNPYLPLYEYVPDGEPHVFGDRVYIFGSHDEAGGDAYCPGHYMGWSAPLNDLSAWECHGITYRRTQDPSNAEDRMQLWAPDVTQGPDGRYYLYYCFSFHPEIGVAVSDTPKGPFEFLGHVKYAPDVRGGKELNEHLPFDPAVLTDDDGRVYLYYGFSPCKPLITREKLEERGASEEEIQAMLAMAQRIGRSPGAMVVELEADMLTMKGEPRMMIPGGLLSEGTGFEDHAFYEASSIRKVGGKYYFVYSSQQSHELCYAISDHPDRDYVYGGCIISNGDLGYQGNTVPKGMMGNNHGGLVQLGEAWYIFYHRQTHGTESSRQGCAEKVTILPDGSIPQVEVTSCGLNGGALEGRGTYPAAIACNLICPENQGKITMGDSLKDAQPYIYEELEGPETEHIQYVANVKDGVTVGYKYFAFQGVKAVTVRVRGNAAGELQLRTREDGGVIGSAHLALEEGIWTDVTVPVQAEDGEHALFFVYSGEGSFQLREFTFQV